jgi:hypothetical protein
MRKSHVVPLALATILIALCSGRLMGAPGAAEYAALKLTLSDIPFHLSSRARQGRVRLVEYRWALPLVEGGQMRPLPALAQGFLVDIPTERALVAPPPSPGTKTVTIQLLAVQWGIYPSEEAASAALEILPRQMSAVTFRGNPQDCRALQVDECYGRRREKGGFAPAFFRKGRVVVMLSNGLPDIPQDAILRPILAKIVRAGLARP